MYTLIISERDRNMAPSKDQKRKEELFFKESFMFKHAKKVAVPDPSFVSLHACKRNFGFSFTDFSLTEVQQVVWGVRRGQQGYFVPPEVNYYIISLYEIKLWITVFKRIWSKLRWIINTITIKQKPQSNNLIAKP